MNDMDKEKERKLTGVGINVSVFLIGVSLIVRLFCSDLSLRPGILRSARLGLELLLEVPLQRLQAWYAGSFIAPFLVFMLSILPVLLLIISLCVRFEVIGWIREHWPFPEDDDTEEEPFLRRKPSRPHPENDPIEIGCRENYEKAMARLEVLWQSCEGKDIFQEDRGVRVQTLSGDPKQRTDSILEWDMNGIAAIRLNAQTEIHLQKDNLGTPYIFGLYDLGEDGEHDWQETWHELKRGETLKLQRQSGSKTVDRYAITWLGGREE